MSATDSVRLTDLASPRFSPDVAALRDSLATLADGVDFAPDALRARAAAELGLSDFGDAAYAEPLAVLAGAIDRSPLIAPVGRVMLHQQLLQLLRNRLLLTDLLVRHPEIHAIPVARPIVICGLPRTGTTHLHNLMAADPALRSLPYWESLEPIPLPAEAGVEPDPRLLRCALSVQFIEQAMPEFKRMHEMTTWHAHEEIQLLAMDCSTMLFESLTPLAEWREYYLAHDQTPHYRYLRTVLQALQFLRGGRRWVLKSPQHLEQFGPLRAVFPDATFVVTHRDPATVVTSMATMLAYSARMMHARIDPAAFGAYWADRLETMLRACVRDRDLLPVAQSIDVRFDDFMADDLAMVQRIYALAEQPFDAGVAAAMQAYMTDHPQGRHGRVDYRAADVGFNRAELERRFAFYTQRFIEPTEECA
ncbi:MAG: sulfotransferase [Deltaproteobacteria bacterium]|nr:sulfotransferase [Deltaproteobacteria bacterium]